MPKIELMSLRKKYGQKSRLAKEIHTIKSIKINVSKLNKL